MNESVDILVIGGGINGAGIARDAAGRGLKVALVEQADLAGATSSASTKLIHGGLRYLESFEFKLVRESLIERERLLALAPHIIYPMQFVLPHAPALRPRWQIRLGLLLYDRLGGRRQLPASHGLHLGGTAYGSPLKDDFEYGFVYSDCWVDDSRLVVLNVLDAAERGASIRTRTKFVSAHRENELWQARCENTRTGARIDIAARAIVNAAGPWVNDVLRTAADVATPAQMRLVQGSHIVVPRLFPGEHAYLLQNPDGRIVFAIPYEQRFTLIGTTDVPYVGDPASAAISDAEIEYLCATLGRYFRTRIAARDIRWAYAGVRPLVDDDNASASKVTRDYRLELDAAGAPLLSVFGGKITTYRRLAEIALERLAAHLGPVGPEWTGHTPLPGGDLRMGNFGKFLHDVKQRWAFLPDPLAHRLARAYGARIEHLLGPARSLDALGQQFGSGLSEVEVEYLRNVEWAATSDDILWRRTKLGLHMTQNEQAHLMEYFDRVKDRSP